MNVVAYPAGLHCPSVEDLWFRLLPYSDPKVHGEFGLQREGYGFVERQMAREELFARESCGRPIRRREARLPGERLADWEGLNEAFLKD